MALVKWCYSAEKSVFGVASAMVQFCNFMWYIDIYLPS